MWIRKRGAVQYIVSEGRFGHTPSLEAVCFHPICVCVVLLFPEWLGRSPSVPGVHLIFYALYPGSKLPIADRRRCYRVDLCERKEL